MDGFQLFRVRIPDLCSCNVFLSTVYNLLQQSLIEKGCNFSLKMPALRLTSVCLCFSHCVHCVRVLA